MPSLVVKPRVRETSQSTGTGDYTLLGALGGYRPFSDVGANNYTEVHVTDGTNWEEGLYTFKSGPDRLERTHVLGSSNGGAAVNWTAGTRTLRCGPLSVTKYPRRLSKDVAGGAGTTVLTADEQRRQILQFTGALTGARTIECDATPWTWIVQNDTSGAFTLTFKVGASQVNVLQGKRCVIWTDGSTVYKSSPATSGNDSEFATGTRLVFQQTTAPVGWTKETGAAYNDAALRMTTGTVGTGGADVFTTLFGTGKSTAGFTLTTAEIPSHTHSVPSLSVSVTGTESVFRSNAGTGTDSPPGSGGTMGNATLTSTGSTGTGTSGATGGGASHDHVLNNMNLKFADVIVAAKD